MFLDSFERSLLYIKERERTIVFRKRTNCQQPQALGGNPGWWRRAKAIASGRPGSNPVQILIVGCDPGSVTDPLLFPIYEMESSPSSQGHCGDNESRALTARLGTWKADSRFGRQGTIKYI